MKPIGPVFDGVWRKECRIERVSISDVSAFISAHYLKKRPAIVLLALGMFKGRDCIGTVIYSAPPRESNKRYGGETWELARLYLLDMVPSNAETWLIARSIRYIRQNHPEVDFLVSYADPSAGHVGIIYKASNWVQDGRTDEGRKSPRCDYYDSITGKKYGRKGNVPAGAIIERRPRVSKFRFVMPLKKDMTYAKRTR